ncbi:MAG: hypothetical protein N7Q72_02875, partial [Spiroplasma sp. Tabriz.8]|nr:hypothetical protein [Spiroplasma sp. Tabriz.8]
ILRWGGWLIWDTPKYRKQKITDSKQNKYFWLSYIISLSLSLSLSLLNVYVAVPFAAKMLFFQILFVTFYFPTLKKQWTHVRIL